MPAKAAIVWESAGAAIIEWERNHVSSNCDMGIFISGVVSVITTTYSSASWVLFDHFPQSATAVSFQYWIGHYLPFTLKTHKFKAVRPCWYAFLFGKCLSAKTGAHSHSDSWSPSHLCLHSWGSHQKTAWKTEAIEEDKNLSVNLSGLRLSASTFHVLFLTYSTSSEPGDINILYL